jgi:hypothetical protein
MFATSLFAFLFAANSTCTAETWVGNPGVVGSLFKGTLAAECEIKGVSGGGLPALDAKFLSDIARSKQVHSGPSQTRVENLPAVSYDVTSEFKAGDTVVLIRQISTVGTDRVTRLMYTTRSKSLSGNGTAAYLKKLDVTIDVVPTQTPGVFKAKLINTTHIEKPWYAPGGAFTDEAKKGVKGQFQRVRDELVPEMAAAL